MNENYREVSSVRNPWRTIAILFLIVTTVQSITIVYLSSQLAVPRNISPKVAVRHTTYEVTRNLFIHTRWIGYPEISNNTTLLSNVTFTIYKNMSKLIAVGWYVSNSSGEVSVHFNSTGQYYLKVEYWDYRSSDHPGVEIFRDWIILDVTNSGTNSLSINLGPALWSNVP